MPEEVLLGSIELSTSHSVRWVRVTADEGWARVLLRVLGSLPKVAEARQIKLYVVEQGCFHEALRFCVF